MTTLLKIIVLCGLLAISLADVYMHNPRGSNNRNRETGVNRDNAKRSFNSQNNAKGGYCWGPPMTFYEGSMLQVEWTAQHGCGSTQKNTECDIVIQYMCSPNLRDGLTTDTITLDNMNEMDTDTRTNQVTYKYGMNEDAEYYKKCLVRKRNKGLFLADQNLNSEGTARETRQKPNPNDQYGFECQEERDYYPYWHPTPWRDIAVITSNRGRCAFFQAESHNVKEKHECADPRFNNQNDCKNSSQWVAVRSWGIDAPECLEATYSRDNHLGNTPTGMTAAYNWKIPSISTLSTSEISGSTARCVLRIRYNISTTDYDGWGAANGDPTAEFVDYRKNGRANSPIRDNPYVNFSDPEDAGWVLRLALNTDQTGRTFQDRSFIFYIAPRPAGVPTAGRLLNLNVRGKRGNIVEAYPAVEYDFTPNNLMVNLGDWIHVQWTGCDTNPNYAGEGTQRTDRSNMVQVSERGVNYPLPIGQANFWPDRRKAWEMAYLNQYGGRMCATDIQADCCKTYKMLTSQGNPNQDPQNCAKINDPAAAYYDAGVMQVNTAGEFNFVSTRNNNFSNRSQKMTITVSALLSSWGIAIVSIGGATFTAASAFAATAYYAHTHPQSAVANLVSSCKL